jgi:hypothetical protein
MKTETLDKKALLKNRVISWAKHNGRNEHFAWGYLFGHITNVYHIDVCDRARTRGCRPINVIVCDGLLDQAIALTESIFK